MLEELEILNGRISTKFDSYNTVYSVILDDVNERVLRFNYKIKNTDNIEVINNDIIGDVSKVIIRVYNEKDSMNYIIYVYKKATTNVSVTNDFFVPLEAKSEETPFYIAPSIAAICFLIIIILFSILFHRKSRKC